MNSIPTSAATSESELAQHSSVGLLLALVVVAYCSFRVLAGVLDLWRTQDAFSHGWPILAMMLYLLWLERDAISADRLQPFWPALVPIAGIGLIQSTGVLNLEMFTMPSLLVCVVALCVGPRAAAKYVFPLLLMHAALPGWGQALPLLHQMTVVAVQQMLTVTGITAFFDGASVTITAGEFIIEDGCSGMNYFIVGTTIAAVYAYLGPRSWRLAAVSLFFGILLSIVANWVRVYGIILIGYFTDMQSSIVHNHDTFGWFIFAGAMVIFYLLMNRLFPDEMFHKPNSGDSKEVIEGGDLTPHKMQLVSMPLLTVLLSLVVALQIGPLSAWLVTSNTPLAKLELPASSGQQAVTAGWVPQFQGATDITSTTNGMVSLHVARFNNQDSAALVQDDEVWADGKLWRMLGWQVESKPSGSVQRLDLRSSSEQVLAWTWYGVDNYQGAGRTNIRLRQAFSRYFGSGTGYLVALSARCTQIDCADAEQALSKFASASSTTLFPKITRSMHTATSLESTL